MAPAKDLYIALRDDPNLEVPEGDSRESAAWKETAQRTRQHHTNAKALGMAAELKEDSAIEKFSDFIEKAKPSSFDAKSVGPFASKRAFNDAVQFSFRSSQSSAASVSKIVNGMSAKKRETLAHNVHEYFNSATDEGEHDLHDDMADWASSLPEEDTTNLLNHLASSRKPFTANRSIDIEELKSNGYIGKASAKGGHKLTVQGAAHLISGNMKTSGKNPFTISEKKFAGNKKDISDPESWGAIAPDKFVPDKTTKEKQNQLAKDLTDDGIFENEKTANKVIAGTTDDDTNFVDHEEKLTDYHDKLGGHPIKSSGSKGHIDNLNNDTTTPVRGHVPKGADTPTEEAPKEESKPAEAFKARIHDRNLEAEDVELQPNGKYKLTDEAKEDFGYSEKVGDSDIPRNPMKDPDQKEYLDNLEFSSGDNISGNVGSKVKPAAAPATTPTPAATKPAEEKPAEEKPAEDPNARIGGKEETKPVESKATRDEELPAGNQQINNEEVSREQHESIREIVSTLGEKHNKNPDSYAAKNFDSLGAGFVDRMKSGNLTKDDVESLGKHLEEFDEDFEQVKDKGIADPFKAIGHTDEPTSSEPAPPEQVEGVGTGDKGVDATDAKDAASAASGKEFDDLMATDHGKQVLAHTYEETHGKNNPFTSEEDHKESLRADYIKNPTKAKNDFSKKWNASEKVKVTAEKAKATTDAKVENKTKKDGITELHQKLREAGHRATKADAAALHDTHNGDIDAALDQKNKDKKEQEAKVEAANTLPDGLGTPDEIKQTLFGDTNPSGALAGNLPERSSNKHGVKATQMARELLIHAQTHKDNMSNATKKSITEQLSILANPENSIKGFKANKGEKFADLDHAIKQIADLEDRGIDLSSPEATQELQGKDLTLQEHRENFKAKHLDGISDSTEAPEVRAAKTVGRVAGKVAGAVKRGDAEEKEHKSDSHARIWDHGTPNHTESFDEEGNSKGRSKFDHSKGESVKGGSDSIHHSPVKEHHGTLTAKQEESMSKLRQAHKDNAEFNDEDAKADIDEHRKALEDSGLSRSDFEHDEDDIPTTGPPDKEVAIYMQGQGYEWHEDTRRWRHKETDDNYRKSNGATKGTFASGSHSETGAHGYMATAEMGADGKVTATPDTGNYAITPAGTHGVSSDLGGSPPTSAQGIQGHVLGHALNNAGVSHDGKSKSFPMSHLNGTGIHDSKHYDKPAGMKASAKRGAGAAYRAATGGGVKAYMDRTKRNWSTPLASKNSPLSQTLGRAGKIGAGLVRDVFGKSDISELTPVELLQFHVALQKAEEKTNLRV